ncbi:MAG: GNAT family N-acetyltransferase [Hyphomicrobiales bacterium]|nr:GNAT family N-acetyltransferase [Hyphomicrobiales bacterium]
MSYSHALHDVCRFRAAQEKDAASIADLIVISGDTPPDFPRPTARHDGRSPAPSPSSVAQAQAFAVAHARLLLFNGRIAGMLLGYATRPLAASRRLDVLPNYLRCTMDVEAIAPRSFYVNTLALYPEYQNLRLGARLLSEAEACAARRGCRHLALEVGVGNPGAIRFYIRNGFQAAATLAPKAGALAPYDREIVLLKRPVDQSIINAEWRGADEWTAGMIWRSSARGRAAMLRPSARRN